MVCRSSWMIHGIRERRGGGRGGEVCKVCTCASVSTVKKSRWLPERIQGQSSAVVAGPVFRHCIHPGFHLRRPSQHVSSQVQPPLIWVKIHPQRTPCRVFFENMGEFSPRTYTTSNLYFKNIYIYLYFTNVHNLQQAQGGGG